MKSLDLTPTNENVYNSLINDSIGRGEFVRQFVKMLNAIEDNCTIALEGNWGSGKTFFVKQVKMVLNAHNPNYQPVNGFLTEERRKDLCKSIKKYGEECKVAVRNVRREAMDKMKAKKKDGELTEDDMKSGEKDVQKLTDKYCDKVDQHVSDKEKEIMSI